MEEFSRECLEVEHTSSERANDPLDGVSRSMDRIYDRAASLVRTTLDVEGVLVIDISQADLAESIGAETTASVVLHHGQPHSAATTRSVSFDEYSRLIDFFMKFPEGRISDGIMPTCFRPFLPTHIQYALSESMTLVCINCLGSSLPLSRAYLQRG